MRLGLVLRAGTGGFGRLRRQAVRAEELGLDLVWVDGALGGFVAAAALAANTTTLRLAACVEIDRHPLEIAEAAVVADQCSNGRVVAVLADHTHGGTALAEAVEVFVAATATRPFRHEGARWRIPAHLPGHTDVEQRVRVTPPPAQFELPLWLHGPGAHETARLFAVPHVAGEDEDQGAAATAWQETERQLGRAVRRLVRPALRRLPLNDGDRLDTPALVARLRREQSAWGLDVALFAVAPEFSEGAADAILVQLATDVAPRVQLDSLPEGLEEHWSGTAATPRVHTTIEGG